LPLFTSRQLGLAAIRYGILRSALGVGAVAAEDLSMRITHVYRREGSDWLLAHRHADPLVHKIDDEQVATLAVATTCMSRRLQPRFDVRTSRSRRSST
jgi:hypothetical protein